MGFLFKGMARTSPPTAARTAMVPVSCPIEPETSGCVTAEGAPTSALRLPALTDFITREKIAVLKARGTPLSEIVPAGGRWRSMTIRRGIRKCRSKFHGFREARVAPLRHTCRQAPLCLDIDHFYKNGIGELELLSQPHDDFH